MNRIPLGPLRYEFSRHTEPRLRIEPETDGRRRDGGCTLGPDQDEGRPA